jgi:hypothetical protein
MNYIDIGYKLDRVGRYPNDMARLMDHRVWEHLHRQLCVFVLINTCCPINGRGSDVNPEGKRFVVVSGREEQLQDVWYDEEVRDGNGR